MTRRHPVSISLWICALPLWACSATDAPSFALAIHGGAGTITRADMTADLERAYRDALEDALRRGYQVLEDGGSASDAVVAAILPLEDSPLFNAGVGAVFTADGTVEHDASIMDGATRGAGAVAAVSTVEHPILLAREVMDHSPHVMMVGRGAERFAEERGLPRVSNEMFHTERRRQQLEKARAAEATVDSKFGTVGCVALDRDGHLAAGTSTGGMTNKRFGRVGDSPIIGAGTFADDATCAVSATGHGEFFIRAAVAHSIADRMRFAGQDLSDAADAVIYGDLADLGGTGGVIAIDARGHVAAPFNTEGMYRGWMRAGEPPVVLIYGDEPSP